MSCEEQEDRLRDASERLEAAKSWLQDLTGSSDPADSSGGWLGDGKTNSEAGAARKAVKDAQSAVLEARHNLRRCREAEGGAG